MFWNAVSHEVAKMVELPGELFPTDLDYLPRSAKQQQSDTVAIGSSSGKLYLVNSRSGKMEKIVDGHTGAVLSVRWSPDGSALATGGEDGHVKIWSKAAMLRSTLVVAATPVYSVSWSPSSSQIVYGVNGKLEIKPLSPNSKAVAWKAHDGLILKVAWNHNNNLIISGGEDCRYKVWDSLGRPLFVGSAGDFPVTSLSWSPDGSLFAVGSFDSFKLCDQSGWSHSLDKPPVHTLYSICWSSDSSQVAAACGNGSIIFACVIERRLEWKSYEILASGRKVVQVKNVLTNVQEELEFRENVIKFSMEFDHLLALTTSQCHIYRSSNWNSGHIFDLKDTNVNLVVQSRKNFMLIDCLNVNLYSYEGRFLLAVKWLGMRLDALNKRTIALASNLVSGHPYKHRLDIKAIALDHCGPPSERKCAFIDKNADLYIVLVRGSPLTVLQTVKLSPMSESVQWCEDANMLAAMQENGKLMIWTYPNIAFVDRELLSICVIEKDPSEFGHKKLQMQGFHGNRMSLRRSDGSLVSTSINPLAILLDTYNSQNQWPEALNLCRYAKDSPESACLWASLAGMTLLARQLDISEVAYGAINRVDRVVYMQRIQSLTAKETRSAEIALLCGNIREAESICLQAGYVLRAILINVQLHKWNRAAELAVKYDQAANGDSRKYLQVVLCHRQRFLDKLNRSENNAQLQGLFNEVETLHDWDQIQDILQEPYERIQPSTRASLKT
ncbi:Intraflagellar transport protein 80 -like protein [Halotydeus destructor]|nr:Intraflagellar transport protein 80 -like protein [Halotydeus destructor]